MNVDESNIDVKGLRYTPRSESSEVNETDYWERFK